MNKSNYSLITFYSIAFIIPWIAWSIMAVNGFNMWLFYTGYACSFAGLIALYVEKGNDGLLTIWQRIRFSAPLSAWLIVVIFPFVWQMLSFLFYGLFFNQKGIGSIQPANISNLFTWHILWLLTTGPLEEEFGWRGYLLPKLLTKYKFITANIILGLIWAFWHLPIMYQKWTTIPVSSLYFFVGVICFAMIIGIVYIISKGNLLLCVLAHWSINATQEMSGSIFPDIDLSVQFFHVFSVVILVFMTSFLLYFFRKDIELSADIITINQKV